MYFKSTKNINFSPYLWFYIYLVIGDLYFCAIEYFYFVKKSKRNLKHQQNIL